jgi:hypothetical protein
MKKNLIILVVVIVVLVFIIVLTKNQKPVVIENPTPLQENTLVEDQTAVLAEKELDTINVDAGIDEDMKVIDVELENL